jgi:hypothetical protein
MLKQLLNIAKNASAFLQQGVCPPNTPIEQQQEYKNKNHFASKKFFLTFSGFLILGVFYISSVLILWFFRESTDLLTNYALVFSKTIEVFTAVMMIYLGGQSIVDLKYNSSSNYSSENKREVVEITEKIIGTEKEDDYTLDI